MAFYLDTSALVKLVAEEPESTELRRWLSDDARVLISSDLARTELTRAARRVSPELTVRARAVLDSLTLVSLDAATFDRAALIEPTARRSLDALHLAVALELGDDLEAIATYDDRLALAATAHGIAVVAPA